ncbi:hypothetical protein [Pseudoclavibacter sp. 8L]|uniref:hypothetical protein n=1 Tax=Pseudoclavibacter sp. 8L TaxID=2653162 RepID=UPI0012F2E577|nr:hypothetical protein [Pseudoclavibacter sp. 8L]VXB76171.1 conserved hypothetical protein [Pseudoclavibacter sp. 8L]
MADETQEQALHIADNGRIYSLPSGDYLYAEDVDALRAFFLHEHDESFKLWRPPNDPGLVVQEFNGSGKVIVQSVKRLGDFATYTREEAEHGVNEQGETWGVVIARKYFAAHPEPMPYAESKEGDVWMIRNVEHGLMKEWRPFEHKGSNLLVGPSNSLIPTMSLPGPVEAVRVWPVES